MMSNDLDEKVHEAGVISRIHLSCVVARPVVVVLDGVAVEIALADARSLFFGLGEALLRVEESQTAIRVKMARLGHVASIGATLDGMTVARSHFGEGPYLVETPAAVGDDRTWERE